MTLRQGVVVIIIYEDGAIEVGPLYENDDEALTALEQARALHPTRTRVLAVPITEAV